MLDPNNPYSPPPRQDSPPPLKSLPPSQMNPYAGREHDPRLIPHRGGTILALGICGFAACFICGIIAWSMGKTDLERIESGQMDPSGYGITKAGKICGMVSSIVGSLVALLYAFLIFAGTRGGR
jgi:hypothetical protein